MDRTKFRNKPDLRDEVFDVSDSELESTLESYLEHEEKEDKPRLLNFVSMTGLAMLTVGFLAVIQLFIPAMTMDFGGLLTVLPIFGGLLALFYGLGIVGRERRKKKKKDKKINDLKEMTRAKYVAAAKEADKTLDSFALKHRKKLFKSRKDKKIFGVCGGIAEYFGIDPTLIRILFVVFFLVGSGTPALVYFILGMVLDKEPPSINQ